METLINQQIANYWDHNLQTRAQDLEQGTDLTYLQVIKPWVLSEILIHNQSYKEILDIGCGCGYLTNAIYESTGVPVTGIDISPCSIAYAMGKYPSLHFECRDFYRDAFETKYDKSLAVMVLNNMPDLNRFFSISYDVLNPGGKLIIVIPHPFFWTKKHLANYAFSYMQEGRYSISFSTKGRSDYESPIYYFHRPICTYIARFVEAGFLLEHVCELCETETSHDPEILGIVGHKPNKES